MKTSTNPTVRKAEPAPATVSPWATEIQSVVRAEVDRAIDAVAELVAARPAEHLLTPGEASQVLQVSPSMVRTLRLAGMPAIAVGESHRYERAAILAWLRARTEAER